MNLTDLIDPPKNSQKELHQWQLPGCSIRPMGNYLKALGLLRIVPGLRGYWQGNNFAIESQQTPKEIIDRILNDYQPSAICTPWNGSSGFFPKKIETKDCRLVAQVLKSSADRFARLKNVYSISQKLIQKEGFKTAPKNQQKIEFIAKVRSKAIEPSWANWLNVVSVPKINIDKKGRTKQEFAYPGLTGGTGGIIGSKDMSASFVEALSLLWDLETGLSRENTKLFLEASLLGKSVEDSLIRQPLLTQFYPINDYLLDISGAKGHSEYAQSGEAKTTLCNPFDAVLIYEGLLTFSGVSCRIKNTNREKTSATFSFAVDLAVGTADLATFTEDLTRVEEIWCPLWKVTLTWDDVRSDIFNPNRRRLPNQQVTDTIDMAYALSKWSEDNEIERYIRYAFLPRKGRSSNFAIPVGEFILDTKRSRDLAAQLRYFRLDCRYIARSDNTTPALKSAISLLEKELVKLANGTGSYLNCLMSLGILEREISYSSILNRNGSYLNALQPLKPQWIDLALAEDKSVECRLGIALASLGLRQRATKIRINAQGKSVWVKNANLDWSKRSLVDNLIFLQRRWLIERSQGKKPIPRKLVNPSFADIENFIRGNVSDRKIEQIALGASICISLCREFKGGYLETLPPHYGIGAICQWGKTESGEDIGGQGLILNALSRGQPELAMKYGLKRLRSRELFPYLKHPQNTNHAKRIAAAFVFPLSTEQLKYLERYYIRSAN